MSGIQQLLLGGSPAGYQIERSLRFNSADSAYLNRTPASAGNRRTWTWSGWVKFAVSSTADQTIFSAGDSTGDQIHYNNSSNNIRWFMGGGSRIIATTQVFRDPSAWYHLVFVFNSTSATSSNRMRMYVNGVEVTAFASAAYPAQNYDGTINTVTDHKIGFGTQYNYLSGYLTEINFIDGQALTPSSFGQTNASTGVWEPIRYTGTYGTNGFYLNFSDNSNTTAATLGKDYSGNGNNWTPNNFSVTAGAGNDSLVDTPTSYGTDTGVGGEVRGNYATLNPLGAGSLPLSNGNLDGANGSGSWRTAVSTIGVSSGKWYCEMVPTSGSATQGIMFGITQLQNPTSYIGSSAVGYAYYGNDGKKYNNAASATYGATVADNDIVGMALDLDAGTLVFYKNNVSQGTAYSGLSGTFYLGLSCNGTATATINFGQRPFAYTAPSGFKALCTQNLPTPTISNGATVMAASLFTGTSSNVTVSNAVNGISFQPDFLWIKARSNAQGHSNVDSVRGANKLLQTNLTSAESTLTNPPTFNTDGFTSTTDIHTNGYTYVAWQWKANGAGSSNTAGSITSTVSANTTAGFSIVTYTGTGANATVGHGLGVAPKMVIVKNRDEVYDWPVWHTAILGSEYLYLNTTSAKQTAASLWNSTTPTSTVFSIGTSGAVNNSTRKYVAYCFAEVAGYSAFGSYTGNGSSDGPFLYFGFRARYICYKRTDTTGNWNIIDTARNPYNQLDTLLRTNLSNADETNSVYAQDITANGWKIRSTNVDINVSGATYIYAAFAESPFKYSLAR